MRLSKRSRILMTEDYTPEERERLKPCIREWLIRERERLGFSREVMARNLYMSPSAYNFYEHAYHGHKPTAITLEVGLEMAKLFGCTMEDIARWEGFE